MQELVRSCFSRGDLRLLSERADRGEDGPGIKNTRGGAGWVLWPLGKEGLDPEDLWDNGMMKSGQHDLTSLNRAPLHPSR